MCYAKPGPRCSSHTLKDLQKIQEETKNNLDPKARERIWEAQLDYYSTKTGEKQLREKSAEALMELHKTSLDENPGLFKRKQEIAFNSSKLMNTVKERQESIKALVEVNKKLQENTSINEIDTQLLKTASKSPRITDELAQKLRESDDAEAELAKNPYVSKKVLDSMLVTGTRQAQLESASNPSLDESSQMHIAVQGDQELIARVSANPNLTQKVKYKIINDGKSSKAIWVLSRRSDISPQDASAIINSSAISSHALVELARKPTSFTSTLHEVKDKSKSFPEHARVNVEYSLAKHSNASPQLLKELNEVKWEYSDYELDEAIAENPNTSDETLEKLSHTPNRRVLFSIAKHPNTSKEVLEKLTHDEYEDVRIEALRNYVSR